MTQSLPERAECGSPGSRPERGLAHESESEPNVVCARPSPPSGKAAGGSLVSPDGSGRPEVVERARALLGWAIPLVAKFPRSFRFTLGERMERRLYDLLEGLVRASYAKRVDKAAILAETNLCLEVFRHELRLAFDFRLFSAGQIEHATRLCNDVGNQVGGWLRSLR